MSAVGRPSEPLTNDAIVILGKSAPPDDLSQKVMRSALDVENIRKEATALTNQLFTLGHAVRAHIKDVDAALQHATRAALDDPSPDTIAALGEALVVSAGAHEGGFFLQRLNRAMNALQEHVQGREKMYSQTESLTWMRGRCRELRKENARYRAIARSAEEALAANAQRPYDQRLPQDAEHRLRQNVVDYQVHSRSLASMESQLVNPTSYVPLSERQHMENLMLSQLVSK